MAEGATASSAAGLVSPGLQVCSGLVTYINAYKNYGKDTAATLQRIGSLVILLEYLAFVLRDPGLKDFGAASLVEDEILACSEVIVEL